MSHSLLLEINFILLLAAYHQAGGKLNLSCYWGSFFLCGRCAHLRRVRCWEQVLLLDLCLGCSSFVLLLLIFLATLVESKAHIEITHPIHCTGDLILCSSPWKHSREGYVKTCKRGLALHCRETPHPQPYCPTLQPSPWSESGPVSYERTSFLSPFLAAPEWCCTILLW